MDVFAAQTEVTEKVAAALGGDLSMGQVTKNEVQRAKRLRPSDLRAYDYFLLGEEAKSAVTRESIPRGIELLTKAITLDPGLARAYGVRAWLYNFSIMYGADGYGADGAKAIAQMTADAEKAVALDPQDAESLATLALARTYAGRFEEAEAKLLAAFPNVSAERMLDEDYTFAREADEAFFVDTFKLLELPVCLSAAEVTQMGARHLLPACEQERARTAAVKS